MGVVYRARQCSLNRLVALKVLSSGLGLTTKAIMRFKLEAEAAAKLHHTNIVPIYWTGEEKRVPYYAMELIDGPSLDRVIKQLRAQAHTSGKVTGSDTSRDQHVPDWIKETLICASPGTGETSTSTGESSLDSSSSLGSDSSYDDNLAEMMADVADALAHAHDQGVVHRDIKPANLLLSSDGRLSVNDFGLARILEQPGMTMTGELMGSPMYMSPEQITAGRLPLDHRTDIYSLGASLYELLTLTPPFPGQQRDQVLSQVIHKDPPKPRSINPRIPRDLETICLKAMEKDPDRRYQTAEQMAKDLRCFVNRHAISARRTGPLEKGIRWVRKNIAMSAMACLVLFVCVVAFGIVYVEDRRHKRDEALNKVLELAMNAEFSLQLWEKLDEAIDNGADEIWRPLMEASRSQLEGDNSDEGKVVSILEEAIKEYPQSNLTARWMLAEARMANGDWEGSAAEIESLNGQYPERPEECVWVGGAIFPHKPEEGLRLMQRVVNENPSHALALISLANAKVFYAIDKGGNVALVDEAFRHLKKANALLEGKDNAHLVNTRIYSHITKAFLIHFRKRETEEAKRYLLEHSAADALYLRRQPQSRKANYHLLYYYMYTEDFDGMYHVMEHVIANKQRGWVQDPFLAICFEKPEWMTWKPDWKYKNPTFVVDAIHQQEDLSVMLARSVLETMFLSEDYRDKRKSDAQKFLAKLRVNKKVSVDSILYYHIFRYNAGEIDDAEKLMELVEGSERELSVARFTTGMRMLSEGNRKGALKWFGKEIDEGTMYHWTPHNWCRALHSRMMKDEDWPSPALLKAPD